MTNEARGGKGGVVIMLQRPGFTRDFLSEIPKKRDNLVVTVL